VKNYTHLGSEFAGFDHLSSKAQRLILSMISMFCSSLRFLITVKPKNQKTL